MLVSAAAFVAAPAGSASRLRQRSNRSGVQRHRESTSRAPRLARTRRGRAPRLPLSASLHEAGASRDPPNSVVSELGEAAGTVNFPEPSAVNHVRVPGALEAHRLEFKPQTGWLWRVWLAWKLVFVRVRLRRYTTITVDLEGPFPDSHAATFPAASSISLEDWKRICRNGAHDPRICAMYVKIGPLACGYARLQEARRYLDYFRQSGKPVIVYMPVASEREYYLALGADEIYMPPEGILSLRGMKVSASFLRGVLDKIGIEPQVKRIGAYKSAGDQLARRTMSDAQREVLTSLLEQQYEHLCSELSTRVGSEPDPAAVVHRILDDPPMTVAEWKALGFVDGISYENDLLDKLKMRFVGKAWGLSETSEKESSSSSADRRLRRLLVRPLRAVAAKRYRRVRPSVLGLPEGRRRGVTKIGVIRALGAIQTGRSSSNPLFSPSIGSDTLVEQLERAKNDRSLAAVILRVDSPGGSALASDLIWNSIRELAKRKPVIASMGDVAGSGGYYISMGCQAIVAEPLTLTGSIGVVTAKPSLQQLFERIGFRREVLSRGRYAELDVDFRPFTPEEDAYFTRSTERVYESFVRKAAESRGRQHHEFDRYAQGRVWSGTQALAVGLVDALGGFDRAVELCRERLELAADRPLRFMEVRPRSTGLLASLLENMGALLLETGFGSLLQSLGANQIAEARLETALPDASMPRVDSVLAALLRFLNRME
jgi:protease-4